MDIHTKPSCFCIPQLLRTQKATYKMTVTASSAERTTLGASALEPLFCPASHVKGDIIVHPSNFTVSLVSTLIKGSATSGNTHLTKKPQVNPILSIQ